MTDEITEYDDNGKLIHSRNSSGVEYWEHGNLINTRTNND